MPCQPPLTGQAGQRRQVRGRAAALRNASQIEHGRGDVDRQHRQQRLQLDLGLGQLGGRRVSGHWEKVRPGQGGRRIVEEAREIKARALDLVGFEDEDD